MAALILILFDVRVKRLQYIQLSAYVVSDDKSVHSHNQIFPSDKQTLLSVGDTRL